MNANISFGFLCLGTFFLMTYFIKEYYEVQLLMAKMNLEKEKVDYLFKINLPPQKRLPFQIEESDLESIYGKSENNSQKHISHILLITSALFFFASFILMGNCK